MSTQITDSVFHRMIRYSTYVFSGSGLFNPRDHGIYPDSMGTSSGCHKAFYAAYAVENQRLLLARANIYLRADEAKIAATTPQFQLFGVSPKYDDLYDNWVYSDLREPVAFTGGLLVHDQPIPGLEVFFAAHTSVWFHRDVRELIFENGQLVEDCDRSAEMAEVRKRLAARYPNPGERAPWNADRTWINEYFSQVYWR